MESSKALYQVFVAYVRERKYNKTLKYAFILFVIITFYIVSYGFSLALVNNEKCLNGLYIIYEPIEFLRVRSLSFYILTEKIYTFLGGMIPADERKYFNTPRRFISFYSNGNIKTDCIITSCGIKSKDWYENGSLARIYDETIYNIWNYRWDSNGNLVEQSGNFDLHYPDGIEKFVFVFIEYDDYPYVKSFIFLDVQNKNKLPCCDLKYLPPSLRPFLLWKNIEPSQPKIIKHTNIVVE